MNPIDKSLMAEKLAPVLRRIAWAYFFLYFNITIGPIDILPSWAGYLMIFSAIPVLALYEESAGLLRNVAAILAAWSVLDWALTILEANTYGSGLLYSLYALTAAVMQVIAIYFHFQLLTNLAGIAGSMNLEYRQRRLLSLRTWNTVIQTILTVYTAFPVPDIFWAAMVLLILNLLILVLIVICLFGFRKELEEAVSFSHL